MVSVVMATYNGAAYINEQLNSIIEQSVLPDEIVIVDDCSKDNTVQIIENFIRNNNHIIYKFDTNLQNEGYIRTFFKAIEKAEGDIIILCDQDDIWLPNKVFDILKAFSLFPDMLSIHYDISIMDNSKQIIVEKVNKYKKEEKYSCFHFCKKLNYCGMSSAFSNQIKEDILKLNVSLLPTHDWIVHAIALVKGGFYVSNKINAYRRAHDSNAALSLDNVKVERGGIEQRVDIVRNYYNYYKLLEMIYFKENVDNYKMYKCITKYKDVADMRLNYLKNKNLFFWMKCMCHIKYYTSFKAYLCDGLYLIGVF